MSTNFSRTVIKKIRALNKDQLVAKLLELNNYSEEMKAANLLLMMRISKMEAELSPEQIEKLNKPEEEEVKIETV